MFEHRNLPSDQRGRPLSRLLASNWSAVFAFVAAVATPALMSISRAADRATCFFPLASDIVAAPLDQRAVSADEFFQTVATKPWRQYQRVWRAHQQQPNHPAIRRFFGLPAGEAVTIAARRGRSAPRELGWRPGSYQQIDTPHFQIFTRADASASRHIAADLERCYWIWTQYFFPFWEGSAQVAIALDDLTEDQDVAEFLAQRTARITTRRKLRIVLFRDAEEYRQTLGRQLPGIAQSTGFYSDEMRITFLYFAEPDDTATRRHELTHQLLLEATRSALGRTRPGEASQFWLVEGIAGYFESLWIGDQTATVGGWDAPRLQYARYRVLANGDRFPFEILQADGRIAAQQRPDLARWYAHAIARTHQLLDGEQQSERCWLLGKLAALYAIPWESADSALQPSWIVTSERLDLPQFLAIDDQTLRGNRVQRELVELCLGATRVTDEGLTTIPPSPQLRWLDLARLPIGNQSVQRLVSHPSSLEQLNLEATQIQPDLADWLAQTVNLVELDLSSTAVTGELASAVAQLPRLQTLWLTGSQVDDRLIESLMPLEHLQRVDVQRTQVSARGLRTLQQRFPELELNPLKLREP